MFVLFLQTSTNLISGYNWLFVTTDQPYGNIVTWTTEANASRLEPGSLECGVMFLDSDFYKKKCSKTLGLNFFLVRFGS